MRGSVCPRRPGLGALHLTWLWDWGDTHPQALALGQEASLSLLCKADAWQQRRGRRCPGLSCCLRPGGFCFHGAWGTRGAAGWGRFMPQLLCLWVPLLSRQEGPSYLPPGGAGGWPWRGAVHQLLCHPARPTHPWPCMQLAQPCPRERLGCLPASALGTPQCAMPLGWAGQCGCWGQYTHGPRGDVRRDKKATEAEWAGAPVARDKAELLEGSGRAPAACTAAHAKVLPSLGVHAVSSAYAA